MRSDITSSFGDASGVAEGVPLTIELTVLDIADGATPLAGAAVYLWHCDRDGRYSMYSQASPDENYLRGVQETDADGKVTFTRSSRPLLGPLAAHPLRGLPEPRRRDQREQQAAHLAARAARGRLRRGLRHRRLRAERPEPGADLAGHATRCSATATRCSWPPSPAARRGLRRDAERPRLRLDGVPPVAPPDVPFGVYLHVPFCPLSCGYCDFNTYTADRDGGGVPQAAYVGTRLPRSSRPAGSGPPVPRSYTVFFGGGTPTLCRPRLGRRLARRSTQALGAGPGRRGDHRGQPRRRERSPRALGRPGSPGSPSACSRPPRPCCGSSDRRRAPPGSAPQSRRPRLARPDFDHVNLDLIYGTPGENGRGLRGVTGRGDHPAGVDHVSAYSLIVEDGTRLARPDAPGRAALPVRRRGRRPVHHRRRRADRQPAWTGTRCPTGRATKMRAAGTTSSTGRAANWWGFGPGAHSHVGGVRWWNVKHPTAYAGRLAEGACPRGTVKELLTDDDPRAGAGAAGGPPARRPARSTSSTADLVDGIVARGLGRPRRRPPRAHPPGSAARRCGGARAGRVRGAGFPG